MGKHRSQIKPETRIHLYDIAAALVPLAVSYGLIADNTAGLWLALVAAVFSTGTNVLARKNVDRGDPIGE